MSRFRTILKECDKEAFCLFRDLFLYILFLLSHFYLTEYSLSICCQSWARRWDYKYERFMTCALKGLMVHGGAKRMQAHAYNFYSYAITDFPYVY